MYGLGGRGGFSERKGVAKVLEEYLEDVKIEVIRMRPNMISSTAKYK